MAGERHLTLKNPKVSNSVALAVSKPKAREVHRLMKRMRSGEVASSSSTSQPDEDEEDLLLLTPLENKLDKILRATKKHNEEWVDDAPLVKNKCSLSSPLPRPSRGALIGIAKKMGVSFDNDDDTKRAGPRKAKKKSTPRAVKALRPAPGWEDFTEGKQLRRLLLPEYDDTDTTSYDEEDDSTPGFGPTTV